MYGLLTLSGKIESVLIFEKPRRCFDTNHHDERGHLGRSLERGLARSGQCQERNTAKTYSRLPPKSGLSLGSRPTNRAYGKYLLFNCEIYAAFQGYATIYEARKRKQTLIHKSPVKPIQATRKSDFELVYRENSFKDEDREDYRRKVNDIRRKTSDIVLKEQVSFPTNFKV